MTTEKLEKFYNNNTKITTITITTINKKHNNYS